MSNNSRNPLPFGLNSTFKVFAKIYNAFYCSKKTQQEGSGIEEQPNEDLVKDWFEALRAGSLEKVKQIMQNGQIDINQPDQLGWSALHVVSWKGLSEICRELLKRPGINIDIIGPGGCSPITLAAQRGHTDIVVQLIEDKCDLCKCASLSGNHDVTPLHLAAQNNHVDIVRHLVAAGATVNAAMTSGGIEGITPLHLAVEAGHMDVMDILIEAGCNIHSSTQAADVSETTC